MKGDVMWKLELQPLTPVHIGDGQVWDPSEYVVELPKKLEEWQKDEMDDEEIEAYEARQGSPRVHRIHFTSIIAKLTDPARGRVIGALDRGDWKSAVAEIRKIVGPDDYFESLKLDDEQLAEVLERVREDPRKYGEIHGFVRGGSRPFLPGSTLKGAFRTAYLAACLDEKLVAEARERLEKRKEQVRQAVRERAKSRRKRLSTGDLASWLENMALTGMPGKVTDMDPLRYLRASDVTFEPGSTTIIPVLNYVLPPPGRNPHAIDMNMFYEVTRNWATGEESLSWPIEIRVEGRRAQEFRRRHAREKAPEGLDADRLWAALRAFGLRLWDDEREWFWKNEPGTADLLDRAEKALGFRNRKACALVRMGRFAHFEAKSVPQLRVNQHHRRPTEFRDHGATRMVVRHEGAFIPLGWVLVWLRDIKVQN